MKALSIRQPFASAIAAGRKTIECRSRRTLYRGPLLVCSAMALSSLLPVMVDDKLMPRGRALAVVNLFDCSAMEPGLLEMAMLAGVLDPAGTERLAWAWKLRLLYRVDPVPVRGQLGLFKVNNALIRPIEA